MTKSPASLQFARRASADVKCFALDAARAARRLLAAGDLAGYKAAMAAAADEVDTYAATGLWR